MLSTCQSTDVDESPAYGWRKLHDYPDSIAKYATSEGRLITSLVIREHLNIESAGSRYQNFDLSITGPMKSHPDQISAPRSGKYEIKSLYRRNERCKFDRRFKTGSRGERIYGRRDSEIKAFALDLENYIEHGLTAGLTFVEGMHSLIDSAMERRHSKDFMRKYTLAAEAYCDAWELSSADVFLTGGVKGDDIVKGFFDIEGIFLTAGAYFTLISKVEMPKFLTFDSVSVEGVKLRYTGRIEQDKLVVTGKGKR